MYKLTPNHKIGNSVLIISIFHRFSDVVRNNHIEEIDQNIEIQNSIVLSLKLEVIFSV